MSELSITRTSPEEGAVERLIQQHGKEIIGHLSGFHFRTSALTPLLRSVSKVNVDRLCGPSWYLTCPFSSIPASNSDTEGLKREADSSPANSDQFIHTKFHHKQAATKHIFGDLMLSS